VLEDDRVHERAVTPCPCQVHIGPSFEQSLAHGDVASSDRNEEGCRAWGNHQAAAQEKGLE